MKLTLSPKELRDLLILGLIPPAPLDLDAMHSSAERLASLDDRIQAKEADLVRLEEVTPAMRPQLEADAVIANAGTQALDLARTFFESGTDAWYEAMRSGLGGLLSTLGVEVDDGQLEEFLKPQEPAAAPITPEQDRAELEEQRAALGMVLPSPGDDVVVGDPGPIELTDPDAPKYRDHYHATLGPVAKDEPTEELEGDVHF